MLSLVADQAVLTSLDVFRNAKASERATELVSVVPSVIGYYSEGSAALAADYFADERVAQAASGRFVPSVVVLDRSEKIRRALLWAVEDESRLETVVLSEVNRPYRDTIMANRSADPECVGYRRVARGESCQFCYMLASKGAIFKQDSAYFAAHDKCRCTAQPAFRGGISGPEASVLQYVAAGRKRTAKQNAELREYLNINFPRNEREFWA